MTRRPSSAVVASPVLVGAVTTLVVVVAVFLAYNANSGLPFVPTRAVEVQLANGANVVRGNEVRTGGYRVGVVDDMEPVALPDGTVGAKLSLKLDEEVGPLPVDSRVVVRARSALGLKYVELQRGRARQTLPDGGTIPVRQTTVPVDLDEVFGTFDADTRDAAQRALRGGGDALAGRGTDVRAFIEDAPRLTGLLRPVMANLADDRTQLDRLVRALSDAAGEVAPVSEVNARLATSMADTFAAFSRDVPALQQTIAKGPATLRAGTRSLAVGRPFLQDVALLSDDLDAATTELRRAVPSLTRAVRAGTPVTRRSLALYPPLQRSFVALRELAEAPTTSGALRGLRATVTTLQPQLRYLGPFVTVCNTWNAFWTFTAEHFTVPDDSGSSQRALLNLADPTAPDTVTAQGANEFVHGVPGVEPGAAPQHLHANTWGNDAIDRDGNANCQAGNAGYLERGNLKAPKEYGGRYDRAVVDTPTLADFPDQQAIGPNFRTFDKNGKGSGRTRSRVPEGQTFTDQPGGRGVNP
ncbi:MlaD family protein [Conexibacter sp. SYSU D00693]|uniref:MlaD family protein n=1 Tax=Conexibacter sp. SYSU D00693 TaxID=2812560 RepID=UPI00196BB230|nr:MlaD family protein [Conexibacter sp. SYSU D00693]